MNEEVDKKTCGKCLRLAKIPGHPHKGYCIWLDCLVMLDDTLRNKRVGCFVSRAKIKYK